MFTTDSDASEKIAAEPVIKYATNFPRKRITLRIKEISAAFLFKLLLLIKLIKKLDYSKIVK